MNTWSELIFMRLVDFYVLSAVLLGLSWFAMRWLLRNPAQRMTWSWGIMAALFVIAAASLFPNLRQTPSQWFAQTQEWLWSQPAIVVQAVADVPLNEAPIIPPLMGDELEPLPELPAAAAKPVAQPSLVWPAVRVSLITAWGSAAVLMICWLLVGAVQVRRIKRRVEAVPAWAHDELATVSRGKSAPLFASQHVQTSVALGALRPTILLPAAEVHDDNQSAVRASIRHEWAHIAHGDLWLHALQRLLTVLLFAHPLYWLFRKQTRADQELLADAAASGSDPLGYAEALLGWARQASQRTPKYRFSTAESLGLTMWRDASSLQRRIEMLVEQKSSLQPRPGRLARTAIIGLLLFVGAALSTITVQSQEHGRDAETPITDLTTQHSGHNHVIAGKDQAGKRHVVITQMPERLVIQVHESVLGPDLETTYAAKDSATLQKRHPDVFRLYQRFTAAASEQAQRPVANPPSIPGKAIASREVSGSGIGSPIFLVTSTIGEINHAAFVDADNQMEDIIQTKLDGKCELQGNLIVALCTPAEAEQVKAGLLEAKALKIIAAPRLLTANKQKASIRVGSEVPIATPIAAGKDRQESELKVYFEGIALDVSPSIASTNPDPSKPDQLEIEVKAELSKRNKATRADLPASRRELKCNVAFEPGQILLIAERQPKAKGKDKSAETLFLQIAMQQATADALKPAEVKNSQSATERPLLPSSAAPQPNVVTADVQALREENAELKAQLRSFQTQQAELMRRFERDQLESQTRRERMPATDPDSNNINSPEATVRIYRLRNMAADEAQEMLAALADENKQPLKVTKDERTNSLIIMGTERAHQLAAALLTQLDEQPDPSARPLPKTSNANPGTVAMPPGTEIQKQLQELEVMEAEAVLATAKNKLERLQQMHKNGQVSITELAAAEYEAKAAMVQMALAKRPNDPRFQAEAQLQLAAARLEAAKQDFDRANQLSKTGAISAEEVSKLELDFRRAEIAVRRAKLQLDAMPKAPAGR